MSLLDIVFAPSDVLSKKASIVGNIDKPIKSLIHNMYDTTLV